MHLDRAAKLDVWPQRLRASLAALGVALTLAISSPCWAQPPASATEGGATLRAAPPLALTLPEGKRLRAQKRARLVLAAGVSLTASALVHIAWASAAQRPCGGREERRGLHTNSLIAAGVVGGVGISLTFVGGFRLAASKPLIQDPGATRHRAAIVGLSIGAFAATQLLLGIVRFAQLGFCAS